jgi:DNA mismatch repair protein MutL
MARILQALFVPRFQDSGTLKANSNLWIIVSRIRILSEQLANQIAAGEVVERPASVVKELLENSLDAGASRIDIHVEGGGTGLLRVADNGEGMDSDDVLLSIERHATSKIREEGQLAAIATLGFRGEALPSIASVSWMTILSRPRDRQMGTRAEIRYGVLREMHADGCAPGTVIEIRHLFGNMPARKKFLKSLRTEMHHIEEVVKNQSLAHPDAGFTLHAEGRAVLAYQPEADLEKRVRAIFRSPDRFLSLQAEGVGDDPEDLDLEGYLLLPETEAAANARLRILVNNRPVQDAMIRHAVYQGLQGFLMKGRQPAGALLLTIAPEQVDVNVHPAKREIRFRRSEVVHRFIVQRVGQAVQRYQQNLRTSLFSASGAPRAVEPWTQPEQHRQAAEPDTALFVPLRTAEPKVFQPQPLPKSPSDLPLESLPAWSPRPTSAEVEPRPAPPLPAENAEFSGLALIGQLFALYLLCEKDGQFIVIDQHAAHERLLYGQLRQGYLDAAMPGQTLMFPATVELTPVQAETLEQNKTQVATLGLQTRHFGDATYVITTLPALVSHVDPGPLLREILDSLRGLESAVAPRSVPRAVDDLLASMACKAAVKAGHRLQPLEMLKLLQQMEKSEVFSHCPHGRPVIKTFSTREIEKWFHRHGG